MQRLILTIVTIVLSCIPLLEDSDYNNNILTIINLIIITICSIAIFSHQKIPYSSYKIIHIFILFFFSIAPMIQYKSGTRFMGTSFTDSDYIITSLYILGSLVIYNFTYQLSFKLKSKQIPQESSNRESYNITFLKKCLLIILSGLIFCYFLYVNEFNILKFVYRNYDEDIQETSQIVSLIANTCFRGMSMAICAVSLSIKGFNKLEKILLSALFLLTNFPTGLARLTVAALYIPLILYLFPILRKKNIFSVLIIVSLLVIFPLLNSFRNASDGISLGLNFDQFKELHFDAYSMFMRVLSDDVVTYGHQLLGVLLFWVPRSIWPSKPIGSGAYVATLNGEDFTNVSMPYFAEGYINFGLIGAILFTIFLGYISSKVDAKYWISNKISFDSFVYYLILGLTMFIMRGDLLSSFAFTCGFVFGYYFIKKILGLPSSAQNTI